MDDIKAWMMDDLCFESGLERHTLVDLEWDVLHASEISKNTKNFVIFLSFLGFDMFPITIFIDLYLRLLRFPIRRLLGVFKDLWVYLERYKAMSRGTAAWIPSQWCPGLCLCFKHVSWDSPQQDPQDHHSCRWCADLTFLSGWWITLWIRLSIVGTYS